MLRQRTDRIVIRSKVSTSAKVLLTAVGMAAFLGLIWATYQYGHSEANYSWQTANRTIERLEKDLELVREENKDLRMSISQAQRQLQIDKSAYKELASNLNASNAEITELHKELKFYRSIISPKDGRSGVQIQDLAIQSTDKSDEYSYKLVLIQALRHSEEVRGTVGFEIKGSDDDRQTVIKHPRSPDPEIHVNFRYFQNLEGTIDLPPGFAPMEIKVSVTTLGKKKKSHTTERIYQWPRV
jgi:hypothetical protein